MRSTNKTLNSNCEQVFLTLTFRYLVQTKVYGNRPLERSLRTNNEQHKTVNSYKVNLVSNN